MASNEQESQSEILANIVRRHLKESDNDKGAAVHSAVDELMSDRDLRNAVLFEVVSQAVDRYTRRDLSHQRDRAIQAALDIAEGAKERAAEGVASLLDFPMRSGKRLHAAMKAEVDETASYYMVTGTVHIQRGFWLEAVSRRLPDADTPVGMVLDGHALSVLLKAAMKKVTKMGLTYGN